MARIHTVLVSENDSPNGRVHIRMRPSASTVPGAARGSADRAPKRCRPRTRVLVTIHATQPPSTAHAAAAPAARPSEVRTARAVPGGVLVSWTTESEQGNLGFNVLRSSLPDAEFIRVNAELIPGHGTTAIPHDYSFTDPGVSLGTWYYQLEQVDSGGGRELSHVISAIVSETGLQEPVSVREATFDRTQIPGREVRLHLPFGAQVTVYDGSGLAVFPSRPVPRGSVFRYAPETPGMYLVVSQTNGKRIIRKKVVTR